MLESVFEALTRRACSLGRLPAHLGPIGPVRQNYPKGPSMNTTRTLAFCTGTYHSELIVTVWAQDPLCEASHSLGMPTNGLLGSLEGFWPTLLPERLN